MSSTGLDAFDRAVHKAHEWLQDLMMELNWDDRHRAYLALRAVLQTLRDRLSVNDAVALGAQLPLLIRGFYYDGWQPAGKPLKERRREEFLAHIVDQFPQGNIDPEQTVRAVFKLLTHRLPRGEIDAIIGQMPKEIRDLWPHPVGR